MIAAYSDPAARPGEDQRADRGERVRPAHARRAPRRRRGRHPERRRRRLLRRRAEPKAEWQGDTIGFIGRIDEPRKGLPVLMEALPKILAERPGRPAAGRRPRRRGGGRRGAARRAARPGRVPRHGQRRGQGPAAAQRRPLRRAQHRRRELRHHPGRGDVGGRARCSPATSTPSPRSWTRARPGNCSPTRTRTRWPPRRYACSATRTRLRRAARARQPPRAALRLVDRRRGHPGRLRDGHHRRGRSHRRGWPERTSSLAKD